MSDFRERKRVQKRQWRAQHPGLLYDDLRPFVGVDGEGGTTVTGTHDYFLLRAGGQSITGFPLTSADCLPFIAGLNPRCIYVAYFFDYDTTKICQDLGDYKIRRLVRREERFPRDQKRVSPFPVDVHGGLWEIDWLPRKFLKVRERLSGTPDSPVWGPWITVNDVGTFFQCPFADALDRWDIGTPAQRKAIRAGKEARRTFSAEQLPDIDKYNHLECILLAELMEEFRRVCKRSGYVPRNWQGPGQIAEAVMRARGIPKSKKVPLLKNPRWERLLEFAANAFYGGRPEVTRVGPIPGPVWQGDINSAYPWAIMHLPCLEHGEWEHGTGRRVVGRRGRRGTVDSGRQASRPRARGTAGDWDGSLALVFGHFTPKHSTGGRVSTGTETGVLHENVHPSRNTPRLYGLPVRRDNGSIYYPGEASGWYWSFEIEAAVHQEFVAEEWFTYHSRCECTPFSFVQDLYDMRLRIGKEGLGLYLKLALNSLYGKMAQSIGSPQYANPIWASFITAYCRTQVQYLIHSMPACKRGECGRDVVMVATDAIFTTSPIPVETSTEIGQVSVTEHPDGLLIVQPGLYFTGDGSKPKTRGVPRSAVAEMEQDFMDAWQAMCDSGDENKGTVEVPLTVFIGLRQAVHRNKIELAGTWVEYKEDGSPNGKKVSYDWHTKRGVALPPLAGYGAIETLPYPGGADVVTVPYSREIGQWRALARIDLEDQPDWVVPLGWEE